MSPLFFEGLVEGVARAEVVGDVPVFADLQIVPHKLFVVGMHAVFDYGQCSLSRAFPSQVGHALLRDDYFHVVVAVVNVCHHRDDRRYPSPFWVEGQRNIEYHALRQKSPEPPMPFIM